MAAPSRIVWKCRRGMREMDVLLGRFLERGYDRLDADGRAAFERLLDCPDQDILAWLCTERGPADGGLAALIGEMRRCVGPEDEA